MGWPMTWGRVIGRHHLRGGYDAVGAHQRIDVLRLMGDLRRLERDTRDRVSLRAYAEMAGVTPEHVRTIFDAFFEDMGPSAPRPVNRSCGAGWEGNPHGCGEPDPPIAEPYGVPWRT
jgi:hypothetical protein